MMMMTIAKATRAMTCGSWFAESGIWAAFTVSAAISAMNVPPTTRNATGVR